MQEPKPNIISSEMASHTTMTGGHHAMNRNEHISGFQKSWRKYELLAMGVIALAISLPLSAFLYTFFNISIWWVIPMSILIFTVSLSVFQRWKVRDKDAARLLNHNYPELEESTGLLLKPAHQLGLLEKLQVRKLAAALTGIASADRKFRNNNPGFARTKKAILIFGISVLLAGSVYVIGAQRGYGDQQTDSRQRAGVDQTPEKILPSVSSINLTIDPPAYTGVATRRQQRLNVRAEQGSRLTWELNTKGNPSSVQLIFNDSTTLDLESLNKTPGAWATERLISSNGFYQVKIDNELSEFYQLEIIPDKEPSIIVQRPRPATIIEYGQSTLVPLNLVLTDDYGIAGSSITATIASGNGEAVKFKEQKLAFNQFAAGGKQYRLNKTFNLSGMGMQPGDELYFYVSATDNNKQETRSDIFTIKIEDTAALMSMDGMMSGVDIKPEFFRSQRQIIIETEQLLKSRDTISKETFNNRCNDLGIDQKLLRLRYGKFLGEESETKIGEDGNTGHDHDEKPKEGDEHDDDHDEEISVEDFNNAEKIIDRYAHKHDIAEDATFFDPQTKRDLKAVLAEMWEAELRLRTYKPADALPYEYKALRLLKELQQKSREYVAKTNTKTTPLKPEKRLTGELDKIIERVNTQTYQSPHQKESVLRKAMAIIDESTEQIRNNQGQTGKQLTAPPLSGSELEVLEQTAGELSLKASADPRLYLASFEAIQRIIKNEGGFADFVKTGKALQLMLKQSTRTPAGRQSAPDTKLSNEYFINLNKSTRGS
ncbi:DUF4175 family protein [Flavitalea antarctica]